MDNREVKIRLILDTGQAKDELRDLDKEGEDAAGKLGDKLKSKLSAGVRAVGFGTAIGAGMAAIRGATESEVGTVAGEAFGGWGANIENWILGDLGPEARAGKSARESTISAFAMQAGRTGEIPPQARAYYEQIKQIRMDEEKGRKVFETDSTMRGTTPTDIITRIVDGVTQSVKDGVDYLATKMSFLTG